MHCRIRPSYCAFLSFSDLGTLSSEKQLVSKRTQLHTSIYKSETSCQSCNKKTTCFNKSCLNKAVTILVPLLPFPLVSLLVNLFTYLIVFSFFFCFDSFNTYLYGKRETSQSPDCSIDVIK